MSSPGGGRAPAHARVRMVSQPASVPAVRQFVDDALVSWGLEALVDDVGLSVTELATNATLHSESAYFDVELSSRDGAVRIAVLDSGAMPARSIAARVNEIPDADAEPDFDFEGMTGRGLFIVSSLATGWGIDDLPGGTRVWAEFGERGEDATGTPVPTSDSRPQVTGAAERPHPTVEGGLVVQLLGCPAQLLLSHEENLSDVARDLSLYASSHGDQSAADAVARLVEVVRLSALSWDAARLVAAQAIREGRSEVDVSISVGDPADLPRKVQVLRQVMSRIDEMSRDGRLMTLPVSEPVQRWRDWAAVEMTEQATAGRDPEPFSSYVDGR